MDGNLINRISSGDSIAFNQLYQQYKTLVYSVCLSVLRRKEDAEDMASETFFKVYKEAKNFNGGSVKSYLCTIARNLSINFLNKRKREVQVDTEESEYLFGGYDFESNFSDNLVLKAALKNLSDIECQIVILTNNGLKKREIAEILNEPTSTISWRYSKALKKLKELLK